MLFHLILTAILWWRYNYCTHLPDEKTEVITVTKSVNGRTCIQTQAVWFQNLDSTILHRTSSVYIVLERKAKHSYQCNSYEWNCLFISKHFHAEQAPSGNECSEAAAREAAGSQSRAIGPEPQERHRPQKHLKSCPLAVHETTCEHPQLDRDSSYSSLFHRK